MASCNLHSQLPWLGGRFYFLLPSCIKVLGWGGVSSHFHMGSYSVQVFPIGTEGTGLIVLNIPFLRPTFVCSVCFAFPFICFSLKMSHLRPGLFKEQYSVNAQETTNCWHDISFRSTHFFPLMQRTLKSCFAHQKL